MRGFHTTCAMCSDLPTNTSVIIHPLYLTGFIDGEGCFLIEIHKNSNSPID